MVLQAPAPRGSGVRGRARSGRGPSGEPHAGRTDRRADRRGALPSSRLHTAAARFRRPVPRPPGLRLGRSHSHCRPRVRPRGSGPPARPGRRRLQPARTLGQWGGPRRLPFQGEYIIHTNQCSYIKKQCLL